MSIQKYDPDEFKIVTSNGDVTYSKASGGDGFFELMYIESTSTTTTLAQAVTTDDTIKGQIPFPLIALYTCPSKLTETEQIVEPSVGTSARLEYMGMSHKVYLYKLDKRAETTAGALITALGL